MAEKQAPDDQEVLVSSAIHTPPHAGRRFDHEAAGAPSAH